MCGKDPCGSCLGQAQAASTFRGCRKSFVLKDHAVLGVGAATAPRCPTLISSQLLCFPLVLEWLLPGTVAGLWLEGHLQGHTVSPALFQTDSSWGAGQKQCGSREREADSAQKEGLRGECGEAAWPSKQAQGGPLQSRSRGHLPDRAEHPRPRPESDRHEAISLTFSTSPAFPQHVSCPWCVRAATGMDM